MSQILFSRAKNIGPVKRMFRKFLGPAFARTVEDATMEAAQLIQSYAKAIVHVQSGDLESSIASEMRRGGVSAVYAIGSSQPYAPIEEARGSGRRWEELALDDLAALEHSFLAKSVKINEAAVDAIFMRHLGVF